MIYIDKRIKEDSAKVGDFIYANGELRAIVFNKTLDRYQSLYVTGEEAFSKVGDTAGKIEDIVEFYRAFEDFQLIKSEEMKLIRE